MGKNSASAVSVRRKAQRIVKSKSAANSILWGSMVLPRDMEFTPAKQTEDEIEFILESNTETKKMYPYDFRLKVCFTVAEKSLDTQYTVENTGMSDMYYAIGGHPGFRCPHGSERFEDWRLIFEHDEPLLATPVTPEGVIADAYTDALKNVIPHDHGVVKLARELFAVDAVIFENIRSKTVTLQDSISGKGVRVSYADFPFIAFWTLPRPDARIPVHRTLAGDCPCGK